VGVSKNYESLAGVRQTCCVCGGTLVTENDDKKISYVWDYVKEEPVTEQEMPVGPERWKASEQAKVELMRKQRKADTANS
jgi:hypothetical protein